MARAATAWYVYIVRCADSTLYTGVAIDVTRRVAEHNGVRSKRAGARYTRSRRPVKLVYREPAANRSAACKREYRIKQLPRAEKLALIAAGSRMISVAKKKPAAAGRTDISPTREQEGKAARGSLRAATPARSLSFAAIMNVLRRVFWRWTFERSHHLRW